MRDGLPTLTFVPLAELRKDYSLAGLAEKDLARDPFRQFEKWFQEAEAAKVVEPNAMILATSTADAAPTPLTTFMAFSTFCWFLNKSSLP